MRYGAAAGAENISLILRIAVLGEPVNRPAAIMRHRREHVGVMQ